MDFTLTEQRFRGLSVTLHTKWTPGGSPGPVLDTQTASSAGVVTFAALDERTSYAAHALIDGAHVYVTFRTSGEMPRSPSFSGFQDGDIPIWDAQQERFEGSDHEESAGTVPADRTITAGAGLAGGGDLSTNRSLSVNVDGSTLELSGDVVQVKNAGITASKVAADVATQAELEAIRAELYAAIAAIDGDAGTGGTGGGTGGTGGGSSPLPSTFDPAAIDPTLELSNEGIQQLADDDQISSWAFSTAAGALSQGTAANRPLKKTANGHAVARFDGVNDCLFGAPPVPYSTNFMASKSTCTVIVVKMSASNPTTGRGIVGVSTGNSTDNGRLEAVEGETSGKHGMSTRRLDDDSNQNYDSSASVAEDAWEVVIAEADYANGTRKQWVNGTQVISQSGLATGTTSATGSQRLILGAYLPTSEGFFVGDVYYAAFCDFKLTTEQRDYLTEGFAELLATAGPDDGSGIPPFDPSSLAPDIEVANSALDSITLFDGISTVALTGSGSLTQATAGDRPTKQIVNGHQVMRFEGNSDSLYTDSPPAGFMSNVAAGTIVVVKRTPATPSGNLGVAGVSTGSAAGNGRLNVREGNTVGKHGISSRRLDADTLDGRDGSVDVSTTGWEVVIAEAGYAAGTRKLWVNGTLSVNATGLATGNTSATGALRITLGNFTNLGQGFTGDVYYFAVFDRVLTSDERDYLTDGFTDLLAVSGPNGGQSGGGGTEPDPDPDPAPGDPESGSWGTLDFNYDFSVEQTIDTSVWWQRSSPNNGDTEPRDGVGASWFNASRRYIYNDPSIGYVCRLEAQPTSGFFGGASMGSLTTYGAYEVPAVADEGSVLIEWVGRMPGAQGAWPSFWLWRSNSGDWYELDAVEIFGTITLSEFHQHYDTFADNTLSGHAAGPSLATSGNWHIGLHSWALRLTASTITLYIDRQFIGSETARFPSWVKWHIYCNSQGYSFGEKQPWNDTVPSGSSTKFYQDVKRVSVWTGGSGPPPPLTY